MHWLEMHCTLLLGEALLDEGHTSEGADILSKHYHALVKLDQLIFFVWPASRFAKRIGGQVGAHVLELVLSETDRVRMRATLGRDIQEMMQVKQ